MQLLKQTDFQPPISQYGCYEMCDIMMPQIFYQEFLTWKSIMELHDAAANQGYVDKSSCYVNDHIGLINMVLKFMERPGHAACSKFVPYPDCMYGMQGYHFHAHVGYTNKAKDLHHIRLWVPPLGLHYDPHMPAPEIEAEKGIRGFCIIK